jgi:hypothetical protein
MNDLGESVRGVGAYQSRSGLCNCIVTDSYVAFLCINCPCGTMDTAPAYGAGDSEFESRHGFWESIGIKGTKGEREKGEQRELGGSAGSKG